MATTLFDGETLSGWRGRDDVWSVVDGCIRGRNDRPLAASTYLLTEASYREFRLSLRVRQTMGPELSTMHSAVAALGEQFTDGEETYGYRGPLLMFCHDWGIYDAHGRNRVVPADQRGFWQPSLERVGEWNAITIEVVGDRITMTANDEPVFDHTDEPGRLIAGPLGLQVHSNQQTQEFWFTDLELQS